MRTALVTGAARGIGAATVRALLADGWRVIGVDRCSDDLRIPYALGTLAELEALGCEVVVCDAADEDALRDAVGDRPIDAAIAVAGVVAGGVPLWEQPRHQVEAVLEVDLAAVLSLARVCVPSLLRSPAGRFVAVSSVAATRGLPMMAAYCAAKAGVEGLVRALAVELAGTSVTANCVAPGSTDTDILAESSRLYGGADFATQQPIGRLLQPEEVARAIAWLLAEESGGITGTVLTVDGGLAL